MNSSSTQANQSCDPNQHYSIIIFGASGDLCKRKLLPSLWDLYKGNFLPEKTHFFGYGRSDKTVDQLKTDTQPHMKIECEKYHNYHKFWCKFTYKLGEYTSDSDMQGLNDLVNETTKGHTDNRIFYMSLPPFLFTVVSTKVKSCLMSATGWNRIVVEKPFGKDLETAMELSVHLKNLFDEEQIYRVDHYLGKEMVQNIVTFRFGNRIFEPVWNRKEIGGVLIAFKEDFGLRGRGGFFDKIGIIRDVMQNHLLQALLLIAMEMPKSSNSNDVRDEKLKVLKSMSVLTADDIIIGQYVANPEGVDEALLGYRDDPTVPNDSITPTFCMAHFQINNERWKGVPFFIKCGKGLNERKAEVRIQFKDVDTNIFTERCLKNELVIRIQPEEAIYMKVMIKKPGLIFELEQSEIDFLYSRRYPGLKNLDAYNKIILDLFLGSQVHFVRSDELEESWKIFNPVLHKMDDDKIEPIPYVFGGQGPQEAYDMLEKYNFEHMSDTWSDLPTSAK